MGTVQLPSLDAILQIKDPDQRFEALVNTMGILIKNLSEINGYINSKNIFEAGGWRVGRTELASKDKDVGMSTEDTAADDVRFWAGSTTKETAPWNVTKSGKMTATGALIQSSDGYPKVVIDPATDLIAVYFDANTYIRIFPNYLGDTPVIEFVDGATSTYLGYFNTLNKFTISHDGAANIDISTLGGDILLIANSGEINLIGTTVEVPSWTALVNAATSQTLQAALNAKANGSGISGTVYVASTSGGAATTPITFSNGVRTS